MENDAMRGMISDMLRELEKGIPEQIVKDLKEMAGIQARMIRNIHSNRCVDTKDVDRYNELCWKHFDFRQDKNNKPEKPVPRIKSVVPVKIVRSGRMSTFHWKDGENTSITLHAGDKDDPYVAYCIAACKRLFGSYRQIKKVVDAAVNIRVKSLEWEINRASSEGGYICPKCSRIVREKTAFCPHCGERMGVELRESP